MEWLVRGVDCLVEVFRVHWRVSYPDRGKRRPQAKHVASLGSSGGQFATFAVAIPAVALNRAKGNLLDLQRQLEARLQGTVVQPFDGGVGTLALLRDQGQFDAGAVHEFGEGQGFRHVYCS